MKRILIGVSVVVFIGGLFYFATLGCCELIASWARPVPLSEQLGLSKDQRQIVQTLEKQFLSQKQSACQLLCAKRAQLIQTLGPRDPDRATLSSLVEEVGQEQVALEKATLDHLLAIRQHLAPSQREKLAQLTSERLRNACKATACGLTPGCSVVESQVQ